jgi:hypothetical protein
MTLEVSSTLHISEFSTTNNTNMAVVKNGCDESDA